MSVITLSLPYPPSANRYWRTRVNKHLAITYVSTEAKAYKSQVGWIVKAAGIRTPISGRIAIAYTLHPKRPQDWLKRSRKDPDAWDDTVQCIDLDNANKVLLDALKGVAFDDDKWVRRIIAERGEPRDEACVVITITQHASARLQPGLFDAA